MIEKRIFLIEDFIHTKFMEDLFKNYKMKYELVTFPDLSDERVYKRYLPESYDIYWLHSSSTEFEAIDEIKNEQPWSKIVIRTSMAEERVVRNYLLRNKIDGVISKDEGLNERVIREMLLKIGINFLRKEEK